jgi:hypothetical protein
VIVGRRVVDYSREGTLLNDESLALAVKRTIASTSSEPEASENSSVLFSTK